MKAIFTEEQKLIEAVIKNKPELGEKLKKAIDGIFTHLPEKLLDGYDEKLTQEFLRELLKNSQRLGEEKYLETVTEDETIHTLQHKCLADGDLEKSLFKSLGSHGLTKLIRDVLAKMAKSPFNEEDISNLVELIKARNKLRQVQEKFLKDSFKAYLEKQVKLYK